MTAGALIMAGGEGARMASVGVAKPLVKLRGASLLERNLWAVLAAGIREVWIACRHDQAAILDEVARLATACDGRGVTLRPVVEAVPLGTIGAAAQLRGQVELLVTVNADNLTAISLGAMLARHARSGAALTLAAHDHVVRLPYGELVLASDRVLAYREKPEVHTCVASAICVLGPVALGAITGRTGLHELTARLVEAGARVLADRHAEPWIDINEPADLERAAQLVARDPDRFECWAAPPDLEVAGALVHDGGLLLEHRADSPVGHAGGKPSPANRRRARSPRARRGARARGGRARGAGAVRNARAGRARVPHTCVALEVARTRVRPREGQRLAGSARSPAARARGGRRPLARGGRRMSASSTPAPRGRASAS